MIYSINRNANALELTLEGRLDTVTAPELEKALTPIPQGVDTLVYDFSKVDYISSGGLRVVVGANRTVGKGNLTLKNLAPNVLEIFRLTGFTKVLNIE